MSTFNRLSLHDCKVELRIPVVDTLPPNPSSTEPPLTLEDHVLHAATTTTRDLTEAYIGETIFLLLTIQPPEGISHTFDSLYTALESCGDAHVTITNDADLDLSLSLPDTKTNTPTPNRLPILRESAWVTHQRHANQSTPSLLCKGVWALVRTPPEIPASNSSTTNTSYSSHCHPQMRMFGLAGRHTVEITLRERPAGASSRNSPVWATIDRASRLFGKTVSLRASRPLLLSMPLVITCRQTAVSGSADKTLISVVARNSTADATLAVVPPYVNVGASQLVVEHGRKIAMEKENDDNDKDDIRKKGKELPSMNSLDRRFEFVPLFDMDHAVNEENEDDEEVDEVSLLMKGPDSTDVVSAGTETESETQDDYGLFIPSFNHWLQRAVQLGPREVYVFAYKVVERDGGNNGRSEETYGEGNKVDKKSEPTNNGPTRLKPGFCVETSIAVAWKCYPRENGSVVEKALADHAEPLHREMSSGAVLATGKRGNVAVRLAKVQWRPASLLESVVVTFSGPCTATVGSKLIVSMSIVNQTEKKLENAVIMIQRDEVGSDLLTLRTVIAVGDILPREETSLQLPCIALRVGTLGLGTVRVVENGVGGRVQWESESEFRVVVLESEDLRPNVGDDGVTSSVTIQS